MGKRLSGKAVAMTMVMIMVATAIFVPGMFDSGNVYAADREAKYNSRPQIIFPTTIYANKPFNIKIYGDALQSGLENGTKAYIAQKFSITQNGTVLRSQQLNDATYTSIDNVILPKIAEYKITVNYNVKTYNKTEDKWEGEDRSTYNFYVDAIGKIKIKFNKNKGKFAKGSIKSKTVTTFRKYGKMAKLKKRSGYKFMGWFTAKTGGVKVTAKSYVNLKKDSTLYAQWKYKIKFNANKGKVSKKSKSVTSGKKYGKLPTPKRSGFTFDGWFTKKKGGTKITNGIYVSKASKHTLYAHWKKKSSGSSGSENSKYVTQAEYNKIKKGMTYAEVCNIIGGSGDFIGRVNGYPFYHWYTDRTEKNYVSVNFYESSITGIMTVRSKNNTCGW